MEANTLWAHHWCSEIDSGFENFLLNLNIVQNLALGETHIACHTTPNQLKYKRSELGESSFLIFEMIRIRRQFVSK